ncbi:MAG: protein translocase subunit SecD, partial [Candidatus Stygibacter australis]|nr:protein translocase subunit SecD [Candidatus Stygibacter australis]
SGDKLDKASTKIGQGYDPKTSGKPYVSLEFNKEGAKIFKTVTGQNIKRRLAIVLDNVVYVAPVIQDRIPSGQAQITGSFSLDEVQDLVIVLESGNLPAPVNVIEERTVGPSLGNDSIRAGVRAALLGLALVVVFMIIYYGLSGIVAVIALMMNMGFILAVLTSLQGTLTMPGIAGLILTIGMSVDANVIIFERIREELKSGKTVRSAVDAGFSRALVTILDANLTTLITALVLYQFGTGPIKGFAVTLSIGIVGSMFSAIVLAKAIFDGMITNVNRDKLSI